MCWAAALRQWRAVARHIEYESRLTAALADTAAAQHTFEAQLAALQTAGTRAQASAAMTRILRRLDGAYTAAAWRSWLAATDTYRYTQRAVGVMRRTLLLLEICA